MSDSPARQGFRRSIIVLGISGLVGLVGASGFIAGRVSGGSDDAKTEPVAYNITIGADKKDQAGAAYLKIGKTLLSIGDEENAAKFIEKAALTDGPSQNEASELLAATLAKRSKVTSSQPSAYSASMSPGEVVKGYLAANKWQERLPFVLNPKRVSPLMAMHYKIDLLKPEKNRPATVLPFKTDNIQVGGKLTVTVDVSESSPQLPYWKYAVVRTAEGYKVDWEASQALSETDREEFQRQSLQLENPVVEVKLLKIQHSSGSKYATMHLEVSNQSNKLLTFCDVGAEVFGRDKKYLARETQSLTNLKAKEKRTIRMMIDVDNREIGAWKPTLGGVRINTAGQTFVEVTQYYQVKERQ